MERAERIALGRAWRAVPYATRREVARLAKAGQRHEDDDVADIAYRVAETSGVERRSVRLMERLCLIIGPIMLLGMLLLRDLVGVLLALVVIAIGLFIWELRRDVRHLLALGASEPPSRDPGE